MKTYTTTQGQEFTIDYASAITAGYGHQKITASVVSENGDKRDFSAKTNNMPDFDEANRLEYGQEKFEAFFELVEYALDGEISEWLYEIENSEDEDVKKKKLIDFMVNFYDNCGRFTYFTNTLSEDAQDENEFRSSLNEKSLSDLIMTVYENDESGQKFIEENNF